VRDIGRRQRPFFGCGCALAALAAATFLALLPATAIAAPGDILVADASAFGGAGGIIRVDPATGARTTVSDGSDPTQGPVFVHPTGLAFEATGQLVVVDQHGPMTEGGVFRVDPATGQRTIVSDGSDLALGISFLNPATLVVESSGDILVTDLDSGLSGRGGAIRVNPQTGQRTDISDPDDQNLGPPTFSPWGSALDPSGDLFVADLDAFSHFAGGILRINTSSGFRETVTNGFPTFPRLSSPSGVALEGSGQLVLAEQDAFLGGAGGVLRVDPQSGDRTVLSDGSDLDLGVRLESPIGIGVESGGSIVLADFQAFGDFSGGVIRVNPQTGTRDIVSSNAAPVGGPAFVDPIGLAVEPGTASPPPEPPPPDPPAADTSPPETIKGKGPKRRSTRRRATFHFSSEPGATFNCSFDGTSFKPCTSPHTVRRIKPGSHVFEVLATDSAGNADPTPVRFKFRVRRNT
jgi:hypothetical protein